jgi:hypothetical protein
MIMAAFSQKAELNQACLSVLFCSGFGQKRLEIFSGFLRTVSHEPGSIFFAKI